MIDNSDIIELPTGHVFARGSVRMVSPVYFVHEYGYNDFYCTIRGVGFTAEIKLGTVRDVYNFVTEEEYVKQCEEEWAKACALKTQIVEMLLVNQD